MPIRVSGTIAYPPYRHGPRGIPRKLLRLGPVPGVAPKTGCGKRFRPARGRLRCVDFRFRQSMVNPPRRDGRAAGEEGSMRSTVPLIALALCVLPSLVSAEGSAIVRGDELYARGLLTDARSVYQSALVQDPSSFGA